MGSLFSVLNHAPHHLKWIPPEDFKKQPVHIRASAASAQTYDLALHHAAPRKVLPYSPGASFSFG